MKRRIMGFQSQGTISILTDKVNDFIEQEENKGSLIVDIKYFMSRDGEIKSIVVEYEIK